MKINLLLSLSLLMLPAGGDAFQDGLKLLREGKYKEALTSFQTAETEAKDNASPELLFNKALAAYKSGDLHEAESSAEKAAAAGRQEFVTARDFLRGNIQYQRCETTEKQIDEKWAAANAAAGNANIGAPPVPGAPPLPGGAPQPTIDLKLYDRAISEAETARDAWISAANAATTPPEAAPALRNTERALLKIEELKKKKEEAEKKKKEQEEQNKDKKDDKNTESKPESKPSQDQNKKDPEKKDDDKSEQNDPKDQKNEQKENQPQPQEPDPTKLTPEQMKRMMDKLDEKEKQRQQLLKARARVLRVPKDW